MKGSTDAAKLRELIKKAIDDHVISNTEYEAIQALAHEDGIIDSQERALLGTLHDMIANKSITRAP